jgi:hypothetical protein
MARVQRVKKDFVLENHLISTPSFNHRKEFIKFRTTGITRCSAWVHLGNIHNNVGIK